MLLAAGLLVRLAPAVFQRGNPIPYLIAAAHLSDEQPYARVPGRENEYIAPLGQQEALFAHIEQAYGVSYTDRFGSLCVFTGANGTLHLAAEVYMRYYTVYEAWVADG